LDRMNRMNRIKEIEGGCCLLRGGEFFAGDGVNEAGEEFFGVVAVFDDDVVGQRAGR